VHGIQKFQLVIRVAHHVLGRVQELVQQNVLGLALRRVKNHAILIVMIRVKASAIKHVKQIVQVTVIANVPKLVQTTVQVIAQENVLLLVLMLVRLRHRNTVLTVPAIARLDVQLPVRIRVRLKPHKDVTDAVIHAKQAVEDNAIGLVVAHVTNSVKVHV